MKKIVICALLLVFAFLLTGCGGQIDSAKTPDAVSERVQAEPISEDLPESAPGEAADFEIPEPVEEQDDPAAEDAPELQPIAAAPAEPSPEAVRTQPEASDSEAELTPEVQQTAPEYEYVLNTNTHKFHKPTCASVGKMKESNKSFYTGSREAVIANGYEPCKNCNP